MPDLCDDIGMTENIKTKMRIDNVSSYFKVANVFNLQNLVNETFEYIQRCFVMVSETCGFLDLDFALVKKIFATSSLHITSELQMLQAADLWIDYNRKDRMKHAKEVLLKVRLPLLSQRALNDALSDSLSLKLNEECVKLVQLFSQNKESFLQNSLNNTARYCNQNSFYITLLGEDEDDDGSLTTGITQIDGRDFKTTTSSTQMQVNRHLHVAVFVKNEVYVFGSENKERGSGISRFTTVEKYSPSTNTWQRVGSYRMDMVSELLCACEFMGNIYFIGGCIPNSFLEFDTKNHVWKERADTGETRSCSACAVYRGNVVVSG